jgi:hypothetical protein
MAVKGNILSARHNIASMTVYDRQKPYMSTEFFQGSLNTLIDCENQECADMATPRAIIVK